MKVIKQYDPDTIKAVVISYSIVIFILKLPDWKSAFEEVFIITIATAFVLMIIGSFSD